MLAIKQHEGNQSQKITDELIDIPTTNDLLNFTSFVDPIAESISRDFNKSMPRTIGIYGDWGSGKTSFMFMLDRHLREKDIFPIWFNAWKYSKEDNLWSALLQTILDQARVSGKKYRRPLVKFRIWFANIRFGNGLWEISKKLMPLLVRLLLISLCFIVLGLHSDQIAKFLSTWLLSTPVPSTGVQAFVKTVLILIALMAADPFKLIDLFKGNLGIDFSKFSRHSSYREHIAFLDEFREEFERIVRLIGQGKPLVIMIDDLDRCLPDQTIQVIEAIKNFLDIDGCVFILGVDRKMVEMAVAIKYKDIIIPEKDQNNGALRRKMLYYEAYMDKIIQQPILLPRLPQTRIEDFVKNLCNDKDIQQCAGIFGAGFSPNPRKIKRILRSFLFIRDVARQDITKGEIKLGVLAKLIVLQNELPAIYELLDLQPSLLKDLEAYYLNQALPDPTIKEAEIPQALREQAEEMALKYPELRKLLLMQGFDENDSFTRVDFHRYITLIGALAEVRPTSIEKAPFSGSGNIKVKEGTIDLVTPGPVISVAQATGVRISPVSKTVWNVPYPHNPYFTGREDLLRQIHDRLTATKAAALTQALAISGLGGIGKTQTAVEYAYRYRDEYRYILWVNADTHDTIITSFLQLTALLSLPEQDEQDSNMIVRAVKLWLSNNDGWLLVLDGVDDLAMVKDFLFPTTTGHILLTTRAQATGTIADPIPVETMESVDGVLFLLRRSRVIPADASLGAASTSDYEAARMIVDMLGGLPLAVDQAGAYIEETACGLSAYLEQYRRRQTILLKRRGGTGKQHPEPVATTWSLSFERVEQLNPAAADLLRFLSFLAPDAVPEQLIIDSASELGPTLQLLAEDESLLDEAIAALARYSLVKRKREDATLTVHRLVQAVVRNSLDEQIQRQWAEDVVRAINQAFPDVTDYRTWPRFEQYLPHAQVCVSLIDQWGFTFPEAGTLLNRMGYYLYDRAQYIEAEPLYQRAIAIGEQTLGPEHPTLAGWLDNLGILYQAQGKYDEAEPLYQRAIAIGEQTLGPEHPTLAGWLDNLANLYADQGRYEQAEPLYLRARAIGEKVLGPEHPTLATWLNNLALLYQAQGKYDEAEPLYQRAIAIGEQTLGPEHPTLATRLGNLANLYADQDRYEQAEPLYQRAINIDEKVLGPEHPTLATWLNNLALLYQHQNKHEQAEPLYQRALAINEKVFGREHPNTKIIRDRYTSLLEFIQQDTVGEPQ